jgi:hypothetical protein
VNDVADKFKPHLEAIQAAARPFFEKEDAKQLHAAVCCERLYVGYESPALCGTCKEAPEVWAFGPEILS